jgi:hypothetical protein
MSKEITLNVDQAGFVLKVGAIVVALVAISWSAFGAYTDILQKIDKLDDKMTEFNSRLVGRTPEGFHRRDADELVRELCRTAKIKPCPNPYKLPGFYARLKGPQDATAAKWSHTINRE